MTRIDRLSRGLASTVTSRYVTSPLSETRERVSVRRTPPFSPARERASARPRINSKPLSEPQERIQRDPASRRRDGFGFCFVRRGGESTAPSR